MAIWEKNEKIICDENGNIIECDKCPCGVSYCVWQITVQASGTCSPYRGSHSVQAEITLPSGVTELYTGNKTVTIVLAEWENWDADIMEFSGSGTIEVEVTGSDPEQQPEISEADCRIYDLYSSIEHSGTLECTVEELEISGEKGECS